jgi:hypothetical protein
MANAAPGGVAFVAQVVWNLSRLERPRIRTSALTKVVIDKIVRDHAAHRRIVVDGGNVLHAILPT